MKPDALLEPSARVKKEEGDIELFFNSVEGFSEGKPIHLGRLGFYHASDHSVYIEYWGPEKNRLKNT